MKKLMKIAVIFVIALCMSTATFAMSNDELVASLTKLNESQKVQVEHYLTKNNFTDAQKEKIKEGYVKVVSLMNKEGVSSPAKLSTSAQKEVKDVVTSTASAIGAKVSFNSDGTVTVYNVDGTVATTISASVVKQTGNNLNAIYALVIVSVVAGAAYVVNKKGFINE